MNRRPSLSQLLALLAVVLLAACQATSDAEQAVPTAAANGPRPTRRPATTVAAPSTATVTPSSTTEVAKPPTEFITLAQAGLTLDLGSPLLEDVAVETVPIHHRIPDRDRRNLLRPAHTALHLSGYPLADTLYQPRIEIYPVQAYSRLTLIAEWQTEQLQALVQAWPEATTIAAMEDLPYLPEPNAVQILHAKAARLDFAGGHGIRYVTQYVQDVAPISNNHLLYTFQGITGDGRFYISATLPVRNDALPADMVEAQERGFDNFTYNFDREGYAAYLAAQQALVDTLPDESFSPDLATLDALMQSLDLAAYQGPDVEVWAPDVPPAPDQVLDDFLELYLAAGGFPAGGYAENPHLHPDFVAQLEETVAAYRSQGIEAGHYDPLLMTQLGPAEVGDAGYGFQRLIIGRASIEEDSATVLLQRHWHYTGTVSPLRFTFAWDGEQWQITGVTSIVEAAPTEPARVAEQFFAGMIATAGQFATPVEWLPRVPSDLVLPNADVLLCDGERSWPVAFAIEGSFVQPAPLHLSGNIEEEAYVVIHRIESGVLLTMRLVRQDGPWQVSDVICGDTAAGRALAFYTWYLGAAAQPGETRWAERLPNVDGMNSGNSFLTPNFLRDVRLRFKEDPYLPSARIPNGFTVQPGAQENLALVYLEYLGDKGPEVETLQLTFAQQGGLWLIDNIELAPGES